MYDRRETDVSFRYLSRLAQDLDVDRCLIGGWAVYYTVSSLYSAEIGREYLGSRDIDIGLPDVVAFGGVSEYILGKLGFERLSFRYVRQLDYETGRELSKEEARELPTHMMVPMYIDLLLPSVGPETRGTLGFTPPDEQLLKVVFEERGQTREVRMGNLPVTVPSPPLLLAMKVHSVGTRGMEHKRVKDLCDIAALCLYSGESMDSVIQAASAWLDASKVQKGRRAITAEDKKQAVSATGIADGALSALLERIGLQ